MIQLKKDKTIEAGYCNYGLSLDNWYKLRSGEKVDVDFKTIHPKLEGYVCEIKKKVKEQKPIIKKEGK